VHSSIAATSPALHVACSPRPQLAEASRQFITKRCARLWTVLSGFNTHTRANDLHWDATITTDDKGLVQHPKTLLIAQWCNVKISNFIAKVIVNYDYSGNVIDYNYISFSSDQSSAIIQKSVITIAPCLWMNDSLPLTTFTNHCFFKFGFYKLSILHLYNLKWAQRFFMLVVAPMRSW